MRDAGGRRRVRCLSLWEPWASLMACGRKFVETRGWDTSVRGEVWIHAAQSKEGLKVVRADAWLRKEIEGALGIPSAEWEERMEFGALIGRGLLQTSVPAGRALALYPAQEPFGDFSKGRYGHVYVQLERLAKAVPVRGKQGFFYAEVTA